MRSHEESLNEVLLHITTRSDMTANLTPSCSEASIEAIINRGEQEQQNISSATSSTAASLPTRVLANI